MIQQKKPTPGETVGMYKNYDEVMDVVFEGDGNLRLFSRNGKENRGKMSVEKFVSCLADRTARVKQEFTCWTLVNHGIVTKMQRDNAFLFVVVQQNNWVGKKGDVVLVEFDDEHETISAVGPNYTTIVFDYSSLSNLSVGGRGEYETNAGLGGIGIDAIVLAALINTATTSRSVETILEISTADTYALLLTNITTPQALRAVCNSAIVACNRPYSLHEAPAAPCVYDIAGQLRDIAAMFNEGILTEEEFSLAKKKLLG